MRAVHYVDGRVVVEDCPEPTGEGVRVHVRAVGICGSDLHMHAMGLPIPVIPGHEIGGVLDDGTPVSVEPLQPCGDCPQCRSGDYNMCEKVPGNVLGVGIDGGMAERIVVPESSLIYLPANVEPGDACLIEPMAVALHGLRKAGLDGDMRVAVVGGGVIGLCAVAAAADACAEVSLVARHPQQVAAGERLGAVPVDGTYDLVVECAGAEGAIERAVELCRPNGRLLLLSTYWDGLNFPHTAVAMKGITVYTAMMYAISGVGRDCDLAASLLSRNPQIAETLITHRLPLEEAARGYEIASDRKSSGAIKVVLEPTPSA
jgi:threonine dehydrogenase-like Zn-dependent dehydrogenase